MVSLTALLMFLAGWLPLLTLGRHHIGVWAPMTGGLLLLAGCVFYPRLRRTVNDLSQRKGTRRMLLALYTMGALLLLLFLVVSGMMFYHAARPAPSQATVVVLGASVKGGAPSAMLADRLDAALRYLEANPNSVCIVSGGQGSDEPESEAAVMQRYLTAKGIAADRIYQEDRSMNTFENIAFSREIIEAEGLSPTVVIATQEFHQYRGQFFAHKAGLSEVGPLTCRSPWHLLPSYWIREFAAICRMWLLGY